MVLQNIIPLVTCVNMSDYLLETIKHNRNFFSDYYVLTSPDDNETKDLCKSFSAKTIEFNSFFCENATFNKSGGIHFAQQYLHQLYPDKWILLLDVDIVFTKDLDLELHHYFDNNIFNNEYMYCVQRFDVLNHEELYSHCKKRLYNTKAAGFFQLYFNKSKYYPNFSRNASDCDLYFAKLFDKRIEIQSYVLHLGLEGSHWDGRGTKWIHLSNSSLN